MLAYHVQISPDLQQTPHFLPGLEKLAGAVKAERAQHEQNAQAAGKGERYLGAERKAQE
jgi:hypothetical protein